MENKPITVAEFVKLQEEGVLPNRLWMFGNGSIYSVPSDDVYIYENQLSIRNISSDRNTSDLYTTARKAIVAYNETVEKNKVVI
jgi:hypothetical protein